MNYYKELENIIDNQNITTVFQPIVSLKDSTIIGYEALTRGPESSELYSPDKLFSEAEVNGKLWELECLCRNKAVEKARLIDKDKLLFINVDPIIFKDKRYKSTFTKEFLKRNNLTPDSIIFEITEKTTIEDYKSFKNTIDDYINDGYKIAIDDTGSGYSGLKTLAETKPNYVKIDIDLVRNINTDSFKQAVVKSLVLLAWNTNIVLIAEGIENENELRKLIELGVYGGQGFFLQRPVAQLLDIPSSIKEIIMYINKEFGINSIYPAKHVIGDISIKETAIDVNGCVKDIQSCFQNTNCTGVCIVKDTQPVGLFMKHTMESLIAARYDPTAFSNCSISLTMNNCPLIVDYDTPIIEVSGYAMHRDSENLYDYIIVTKYNKYYGIVTIKTLLQYMTMLGKNYFKN